MILKDNQTYCVIYKQNQVLRKLVKLHNSQNVNQFVVLSGSTATFWCQLVLITTIIHLTDLKRQRLAGAFFLALIPNNSFG